MLTLGLTGGIGSGKTVVAEMLAQFGARVFNADAEARRIMENDPDVRAALIHAFGSKAYSEEGGRLNRRHIASVVFSQPEELERLNAVVHPRVFKAFERARDQAHEDGVDLLVHEAALIFESGGEKYMDAVAVVDAAEETRIARVVERDGVDPEEVRARLKHQMSSAERNRRADYVISNEGDMHELRAQVAHLFSELNEKQGRREERGAARRQ